MKTRKRCPYCGDRNTEYVCDGGNDWFWTCYDCDKDFDGFAEDYI